MIKLRALAENTKEFSEKHPSLIYKSLGKTGLTVSACGFGAYRTDYRVREHFEALEYAISQGINLIDTSANYSDGGSEILIGNVLEEMISAGSLKREEIVIVSKGGYIQGKNLEAAKKMKEDGVGYTAVTEYAENIWHCIHPDFLKDQITLSLERLKLETIDIYLLHNPEYFLDSPLSKDLEPDELRHEYHIRIKRAFEYLETEVTAGRISYYGISSNSFVKSSDDPVFTSLKSCVDAANEISEENSFYVVELPLNLLEKGAIVNKNQVGDSFNVLEYAYESELGVLVNRPLNALGESGLTRLADFPVDKEFTTLDEAQIIAEINLLDLMEEDFIKDHLESIQLSDENRKAVQAFLKAGEILKENWKGFGSMENFNDVKKQFLIPRVNYAFTTLVASPGVTEEVKDKLDKIARQTNKLMGILDSLYGLLANTKSADLHLRLNKAVDAAEADSFKELSLSQKAILFINSLKEVSCTLVGMRQKRYVDDVIGALSAAALVDALEKFKEI
ncbi:MAG: aldo/keto reductase [Ignavibacteria bacterium]|nr:aldo/keto reductase [Ignavibacteria bacterium]